MKIIDAIAVLDRNVPRTSTGLPDDVFCYISRTTPLVNVDLLIQDESGRTLLSWRDDQYAGTGWHIPWGILRFKETLDARVRKVAQGEIGAEVSFDPVPIALNQLIQHRREVRGHFIRCFLPGSFVPANEGLSSVDRGFLQWHYACPENLLKCQQIYRKYFAAGAVKERM